MSDKIRHEATYTKNYDYDPASVFDVHSIDMGGDSVLYVAQSRGVRRVGPIDMPQEWSGMEIRSAGNVHTIESHGPVADMTAAMMAQVAFLQLRIDHRVSQEHEVRGLTPEPDSYERALALKMEDEAGEDGKSFLIGTVEGVMGKVATLLNANNYKATWHQPLPRIVNGFRKITPGE